MSTSIENLSHFSVSACSDPNSLSRVLELFALNSLTPLRVNARQVGETLLIDLTLAGLDDGRARVLHAKLDALVPVESARLEREVRLRPVVLEQRCA